MKHTDGHNGQACSQLLARARDSRKSFLRTFLDLTRPSHHRNHDSSSGRASNTTRSRRTLGSANRLDSEGRVAQWESARFTRERSQVRNPPRPSLMEESRANRTRSLVLLRPIAQCGVRRVADNGREASPGHVLRNRHLDVPPPIILRRTSMPNTAMRSLRSSSPRCAFSMGRFHRVRCLGSLCAIPSTSGRSGSMTRHER